MNPSSIDTLKNNFFEIQNVNSSKKSNLQTQI